MWKRKTRKELSCVRFAYPATAQSGIVKLEEIDHVEIQNVEDLHCLISSCANCVTQISDFRIRGPIDEHGGWGGSYPM